MLIDISLRTFPCVSWPLVYISDIMWRVYSSLPTFCCFLFPLIIHSFLFPLVIHCGSFFFVFWIHIYTLWRFSLSLWLPSSLWKYFLLLFSSLHNFINVVFWWADFFFNYYICLITETLKAKEKGGQQRMQWLDSITNSVDMTLSKLREIAEDRGAWCSSVHGVTKSQTQQLNDNTMLQQVARYVSWLWWRIREWMYFVFLNEGQRGIMCILPYLILKSFPLG